MVGGRISINVLGPIEALSNGAQIPLGGRKQRAVLADLVAHYPGEVSSSRLVTDLWPDEPPATAQGTVYAYVSRLRKALGAETIAKEGDGYRLNVSPASIDAERFVALIDEADHHAARGEPTSAQEMYGAALGLWRGEPFGELGYEDFLSAALAHLVERRLGALEGSFRVRLDAGTESPAMVAELEAAVSEHPFRESLWHFLMLTLYRQGRQAEALRAYRRAERTLGEELGIEPGTALRSLETQILLQDPGLSDRVRDEDRRTHAPVPTNLRSAQTSFVGREDLLVRTVDQLRTHRVVTLLGPGGVGKTRMAIEAAWRLAAEMPRGVWEVDLLPEVEAAAAIRRLAEALDLPDRAGNTIAQIGRRLSGGPSLVLLDNCEHVLDGLADVIGSLVGSGPDITVLATSREPTLAPGETCIVIPPLAIGDAGDGAASPAARLFEERARLARSGFRTTAISSASIERIVASADGLPLAIEIAAAQTALLTPEEIANRLAAGGGAGMAVSSADPRHETVTALVDWSYGLLDTADRRRIAELAVFAESASVESAARLWGDPDLARVEESLRRLAAKSMLVEIPGVEGGPGRFRMLETIREYGRRRLRDGGTWDDVVARYLTWVTELVHEGASHFHDASQLTWLQTLRRERAEIAQALRLLGSERDQIRDLAADLWYWWFLDGHRDDAISVLERAIDGTGPAPLMAARCLVDAEHGTTPTADIERDVADAVRAAPEAESTDRAVTLLLAGDALTAVGQYGDAEAHLVEAEQLFTAQGSNWGVGWAQLRRVRVEGLGRGNSARARALLDSAIANLDAAGDVALLGYARIIFSSIARLHGRWGESLEQGLMAVRSFRELGMKMRESEAAFYPAIAYLNLGRVAEARGAIGVMRRLAKELGDDASLFGAALIEADLEKRHGDPLTATAILEDLLAEADTDGDEWRTARVLLDLGDAYRVAGDTAAAERAVDRAQPMWEQFEQPWFRAQCDLVAAEIALAAGKLVEAEERLATAIDSNRGLRQLHMLARAHEGMSLLCRHRGDGVQALRHLAIATTIRDTIGAPLEPRRVADHRDLAAWTRNQMDPHEFRSGWAEAAASTREILGD